MVDIINVEPDVNARARLKQMIFAHTPEARVTPAQRLNEAVARIENGGEFDLMIVSSAFGFDALTPFLEKVRAFPNAADMVIIAILRGRDADTATVVRNLMSGIHGCLCEPFSVDNLAELLAQARQARSARDQRKRLLALEFILNDVVKLVDEIAKRMIKGEGYRYVMKQLRKTCAPLPTMGKEVEGDIALAAVKRFTAINAPRYSLKKKEAVEEKKEEAAPQSGPSQSSTTARRIIRKG